MAQQLTLHEYRNWHLDTFGEDLESDAIRRRYQVNLTLAQAEIAAHQYIREATNILSEFAKEKTFAFSTGASAPDLTFQTKPYSSVVDKTYRLNYNWNRDFPMRPRRGWTTTDNWFSAIDDLIRTSLVCRYIDGPKKVSAALADRAHVLGLSSSYHARATDDGYYAFHLYTKIPVNLMVGATNEIVSVPVQTEIQVTTQLQEILRDLTHAIYKERRISDRQDPRTEKWDYDTSHFRASYLGHTLHLIESMIVQLRDESNRDEGDRANSGGN